MIIPYPYDWIASWKKEYSVTLSKEAEADLVKQMSMKRRTTS